jgi:hypothetical protein
VRTRDNRLVALLAFAGIVIVATLTPHSDRTRRGGPQKLTQADSETPYIMSQTFIKKQLNVPSTAEFPSLGLNADEVDVVRLPDGSYRVKAWVREENNLGVKVRRYWSCQVRQVSTKSWTPNGFCGVLPLGGLFFLP